MAAVAAALAGALVDAHALLGLASLAALLVVTRASQGCTVYQRGTEPMHIPAPDVPVVYATGAGDVFAGVFLVEYSRTHDVRRSAELATQLASISVTRVGLDVIPTAEEIEAIKKALG